MDGEDDHRDDVAAEAADGDCDRTQAVSELLVLTARPRSRTSAELLEERRAHGDRVRTTLHEVDPREVRSGSAGVKPASGTLPIEVQSAGRREPTSRSRSISRWPWLALRQRSM